MSSITDVDQFELDLQKFDVRSSGDVNMIGQQLGLNTGDGWWLSPHETAVEFDSDGHVIEGAMAEIESQVQTWLRHSFDNNPEFRDNSYHLLSRLNELARLQGLVEEVALKYHQSESDPKGVLLPSFPSERKGSGHAHPFSDPAQPCQDVERNTQTSSKDLFNCGTFTKGALEVSSFRRPPLREAYQDADDHLYPKNPALSRQFVKPSGLPHLHKSQQPPSPHHNQLQRSHLYNRRTSVRASSATPIPSASTCGHDSLTVQPDYRAGLLNRTYSKEALDQLKVSDMPPARRSGGSLLDNFLRNSNHSSVGSDPEGAVDVSRSYDSMGYAPNILSKSLTDGEMFSLQASGVKPNASFSSMRGANVLEMALFQESQLRKLSGSRGKLSGSNSSLTGSSVDANGFLHPTSVVTNSNDNFKPLDADFTSGTYNGIALRRRSPKPNRTSPLDVNGISSSSSKQDSTGPTDRQDFPKHVGMPSDTLTGSSSLLVSEPPTPVVNMDSKLSSTKGDQGNLVDPTTVGYRYNQQNSFFPDETLTHGAGTAGQAYDESQLKRLSSFELMEARVSQEHFMSGDLTFSQNHNAVPSEIPSRPGYLNVSTSSEFSTELPGCMNASKINASETSKRNVPRTSETTELRPQSKIPFYSARGAPPVRTVDIPAPSKQLPTLSMRSRTGLDKPSTHSSLSKPSSNQVDPPLQLRNHSSRSTPSLTPFGDVRSLSSKPRGPSRPVTKITDAPSGTASNINIHQPKASRSNVSPVRSRRFARGVSDVRRTHHT
ncbi:unnamed protein product [Dicrocoelium dendriticum]|nr:unnamed protein product [Dicrocoelium dendriticum]